MNIHFDTDAFANNPRGLISVLSNLKGAGQWSVRHDRDVERVACRTPSLAYNFCRFVNGAFGVSREAERVFLKNPGIGIRYLRVVNRKYFWDDDTQRRFWKKVSRNPDLCYSWSQTFHERVPDESVFVKNVRVAKNYAYFILKEPFPEEVHNMLVLRTFEDMDPYSKKCLTDYISWAASRKL